MRVYVHGCVSVNKSVKSVSDGSLKPLDDGFHFSSKETVRNDDNKESGKTKV